MTPYQECSLYAKEPGYPEASHALSAVAKEMLFTLCSKQHLHFFCFLEEVLSSHVAQAGIKLVIFLPRPPKWWANQYSHSLPSLFIKSVFINTVSLFFSKRTKGCNLV